MCTHLISEHASPALEEFLDCIGHRVRLQGFDKYRGGLDNKSKLFLCSYISRTNSNFLLLTVWVYLCRCIIMKPWIV